MFKTLCYICVTELLQTVTYIAVCFLLFSVCYELSFVSNQPRIYKVEKYQTKNSFSMCIKVCVVKSLVRTLRTLLKFLSVLKEEENQLPTI